MTTKIIWRLKEQPTSESLRELVKDSILTKEEAREILFSQETEKEVNEDQLKSEIKFLRELVDKLSNHNNVKIVEVIKEVEKPYRKYPWYEPYITWCGSNSSTSNNNGYNILDSSGKDSFTVNTLLNSFSSLTTF